MDDLKVLDAGLRHPTVEVQHVALRVVAPNRRLEGMDWIHSDFDPGSGHE